MWARPDLNWGPTGVFGFPYEPVALTELPVLKTLSYGPTFHGFEIRWL